MTGHQLKQYPFPVAYPARRLSTATDPADQVVKAQRLAEMVAATLGVIAFGWCQARLFDPGGTRDWHHKTARKGPGLESWIKALRAMTKAMRDQPDDPVASAIRLASKAACPALTRCRLQRTTHLLGRQISLRGGRETGPEEASATADAIMEAVEPLAQVRLGLVRLVVRSGHSYLAALDVLAGPGAPFPSHSLICQSPYAPGSVIVYHEGHPDFAVDLTPYCIWRRCPACGTEELFYLQGQSRSQGQDQSQDRGEDLYVSFTTGHEIAVQAERPPARATAAGSSRARPGPRPLGRSPGAR